MNYIFWQTGDSGYPLEPWLMKPYEDPANSLEERFNTEHRKIRNCIERTNGVLKLRWRCLLGERTMRYQPETATSFVNICCALHNLCRRRNIADPNMNDPKDQALLDRANLVLPSTNQPAPITTNPLLIKGHNIRNRLMRHL